jgi:hypothetical protein
MSNAYILNSNNGGINSLKTGGELSDGIFYGTTNDRISSEDLSENANYVALHETSIIPKLEEVTLYIKSTDLDDDERYEIKGIYTKNPAKKNYELASLYVKAGKNGEYEKIGEEAGELEDYLNLKGINENGFRITEINKFEDILFTTLTSKGREYPELYQNQNLINAFLTIKDMGKTEGEVLKLPTPSVNNIETIAKALQDIYTNINKELRDDIDKKIEELKKQGTDLTKISKRLEKGNLNEITADDISFINKDNLYKLTDEYIKNTSDNEVIQADIDMAKRVRSLNKDISYVNRKLLNYDIVGYSIDK